jgi:bis(5'-nucleosidyl)-tetraphosphatase
VYRTGKQEIRMRRETHRAAGIVLFRVVDGERQYLLLRSALTRRLVWEFPKGRIESGESEIEAAERELREETGLGLGDYAVNLGFREEEHYLFTRAAGSERQLVVKRVVYFLAESSTASITLSREAAEFRWLGYLDAQHILRFPEKRRVLERAEEWLRARDPPRADGKPE